jgi:F-type H+-transporting ATPase subunit gamma
MGAQLRVYRRRIRSVQATKKITKAMELIASSRIVKAQQRLDASLPYLTQLLAAVSAAASHASDVANHPLTKPPGDSKRAAVLIVTADRGLAGAYSSNAIREGEALTRNLNEKNCKSCHTWWVAKGWASIGSAVDRWVGSTPGSPTSRRTPMPN